MYSLRTKIINYSNNLEKVRLVSNLVVRESLDKQSFIVNKFNDFNNWYIKITGLEEINRLQDRVIVTQEKLERTQEERREIGKLLTEVRKHSNDLQEQLLKMRRWDDIQKFLDLTREETEAIKYEKELSVKFELLDKTEREIFTALSNAVRDSHEKEKARAEYTKYWGIILSIIGTIVGAVASTIVSTIRNRQLVAGINDNVQQRFVQLSSQLENRGDNNNNNNNFLHEMLQPIYQKLTENQKQITNLVKQFETNERYLLSTNRIKNQDQFVDINSFIKAQRNLLDEHQNEIRRIVNRQIMDNNKDDGFYNYFNYKYVILATGVILLICRGLSG